MINKITVGTLKRLKACEKQVELFRATFPKGASITQGNLKLALAAGLDLVWLARKTCPRYEDRRVALAAGYYAGYVALRAKYIARRAVLVQQGGGYEVSRTELYEEYRDGCDAVNAEYNAVYAALAIECLLAQTVAIPAG